LEGDTDNRPKLKVILDMCGGRTGLAKHFIHPHLDVTTLANRDHPKSSTYFNQFGEGG
jgi:hypothetical protein